MTLRGHSFASSFSFEGRYKNTPLGAVFISNFLAERTGFEPARLSPSGFQDQCHQPLGHLSAPNYIIRPPKNRPLKTAQTYQSPKTNLEPPKVRSSNSQTPQIFLISVL